MRFQWDVLNMGNPIGTLDDRVAFPPGAVDIAFAKLKVIGNIRACFGENESSHDISAEIGMEDRRFGSDTKFGVEDRLQDLVFHFDQIEGFLSNLLANRSYASDGISYITHAVTAEDEAILQI